MTILIKNGRVINPATGTDETLDVLVENGVVARTEKSIKEKCDRVIDAKGCFVMPGFIDMHVHLRDPGFEQKETIETGARAAVHGGFTTILAMPNTKPVVDNPDVVNYVHNKAKTVGAANVLQVGAVTKGQQGKELSDIEGMVKAGIPAISEDGKSVMNAQLYREAMELAAKYNIAVLAHCEDINLVNGGVMNADVNARELGLGGRSGLGVLTHKNYSSYTFWPKAAILPVWQTANAASTLDLRKGLQFETKNKTEKYTKDVAFGCEMCYTKS